MSNKSKRHNGTSRPTKGLSRRHFLRAASGAVMAIPFLPSMASKAWAQEAPYSPDKCFFAMGTDHGGVWGSNMYPSEAVLTQQMEAVGRTVRYGTLPTNVVNGATEMSPMCSAAALTPGLASKFNILRGLDIPYRIGHHVGGHLGNFAETVGHILGGVDSSKAVTASLDQFIAWSPSFYNANDLSARMTQRSFNIGSGGLSWNFASPSTKTGDVVRQPSHGDNLGLFNFFFDPGSTYNGVDSFIIDRVKAQYTRLRNNPKISLGDRMRLDQHVERMFEIERKLQVATQISAPVTPTGNTNVLTSGHSFPHNPADNASYCSLMNDVIVAGFAAGISRVGTWMQSIKFADQLINDWHGQVAHGGFGPEVAQGWTLGWNRGTFEHVMVDLASKMDGVVMGDGSTLLDNSLLMFTQEAGQYTHHTGVVSFPVVTAGSAGGFFNTGNYIDFSNKDVVYDDLLELQAGLPGFQLESPGLYYNQFLGNVLQSMGVPASEYESFTDFSSGAPVKGYGIHHIEASRAPDYVQAQAAMGDFLPVLTNG